MTNSVNNKVYRCGKCKEFKSNGYFYRNIKSKNGLRNTCKECIAKYAVEYGKSHKNAIRLRLLKWRENNPDKARELSRKNFERRREKQCIYTRLRRKLFPEQKKAVNAINNMIRAGKIKRKKCIYCDKIGEGHHPDYTKPLEVIWMCSSHHKRFHNNLLKYNKQ